jgi:acyl-CoA thioesterase
MNDFARDTAISQVSPGHWQGNLVPGWRIGPVPNGGYVLAIAGRALSEALPHADPLNAHIMYTAPLEMGTVDLFIDVLREGGSTTFASLTMRQQGKVKAHVSAAYTDLDRLQGESFSRVERPDITSWQDCEPIKEHGIELRQRVQQRYVSGGEVFKRGAPDGSGVFNGWLSFVDSSDPDPLSLLLFADAMAPPVFTVYGVLQWVPTVELSVSVRRRPAPGPLQVRFSSRHMTDGVVEEDGELWDSEGQLVALSRQTSKVRVVRHESD